MNAVYGAAWFAGSVLLGVLYDLSLVAVVLTSALLQYFGWLRMSRGGNLGNLGEAVGDQKGGR